ncbi:hypothetical protein QJQ45_024301 [Haematococcus lacustris]|nr:hypothetical protein QJQ45_024301 [Haematococcus lacustris]
MNSISSVHRASQCGLRPLRSSGVLHVLRAIKFRPKDQVQAQGSKPAYGASYYTGLLTNDIQTDNKATAGDMLKRSLQLAGGAAALLLLLVLAFLFSNGLL